MSCAPFEVQGLRPVQALPAHRRKANRESAARVRLKRQQLVDSLDVQVRF